MPSPSRWPAMSLRPPASLGAPELQRTLPTFRAITWWHHKLVPIVAVFYATCLLHRASIATHWFDLLTLLVAILPGAVYVSLINDATDRTDDVAAGKRNELVGKSPLTVAALLALPIALGLAMFVVWRHHTLILLLYAGAWVSFTLYSVPPFRLKVRGASGALADACGAHVFPALLA